MRGERVYGLIPGKMLARTNIVTGYCDGKIIGEYRYMGNTTSKVFEDWFCKFLLPETLTGDVIIMDNAGFHNKKRLREYARIYKVTIMFPPPYSPDYNPIENVWANLKRFLRNSAVQLNSLVSFIYFYFAAGYS